MSESLRINRRTQRWHAAIANALFRAATLVFLAIAVSSSASANNQAAVGVLNDNLQAKVLRVGIKEVIPFAMHQADDTWTGISVELWRRLADELGVQYEFVELPLDEIFDQLTTHQIDVAIAALTVTNEREKRVDFSHAYFNTGLGIAVQPRSESGWTAVVRRLISPVFLKIILGIIVLLFASGIVVYWFERRVNAEQFGNGIFNGIGNGIWWAAVTMTTVGYGDRVPKSIGGRMMAIVSMFSAILIISSLTATVTSTLTLARLQSDIRGPSDLQASRVATVSDSTSEAYLVRRGVATQRRPTARECLQLLNSGQVDAVVYDAPMLRYLCINDFPGTLDVLPVTFEKQDYAIAIPEQSLLRETINRALLEVLLDPNWRETLERYLGS